MSYDEIKAIASALMPKDFTADIGPEIDGLLCVGMTRPDGMRRWMYIEPQKGDVSVRAGIVRLIDALGGKPKKEEEEK